MRNISSDAIANAYTYTNTKNHIHLNLIDI